jgi:PAS domain S-box-containing protein
VPLTIVAVLVAAAASQQREAHASVARALIVKAEIATLTGTFADADTRMRSYLLTRAPADLKLVNEARGGLLRPAQNLNSLLTDSAQRQHLARVVELARRRPIAQLLEFAKQNEASARVPENILHTSAAVMGEIRAVLAGMQEREDVILGERVALVQQAHDRLLAVSVGGVAVGGLAALIATLAFTHSLTKRINVVRADAMQLAQGQPLTPHLEPGDEVGHLTRALVDASTLLQQREQELHRRVSEVETARAEVNQFFDLSLDLLCIAGIDGQFRRVNRSWETVLGWSTAELMSAPFGALVHPEDVASTQAEAQRLAEGGTTVGFENRYRCRDGSYRWLSWKAAGDAERGSIYAAARDVTLQKEWELQQSERMAQLAALSDAADRASRAKSEFVSRMSHDLRTPLNAILGFAQVLASEPLTEAQKDSVQLILRGGEHLLQLINEVLDIARIEAGQLSLSVEPVDPCEVVRHAIELIAPLAANRKIKVLAEYSGSNGCAVLADRQRLNQLLMNLLSNAVKYNRDNGRIDVDFELVGERLRILVTDTGAGISPEKLSLLFKPFERLGAEATAIEGTGLGLAFSRALAEAMGGSITVTSEVDRGSTFAVELAQTSRAVMPVVGDASHDEAISSSSAKGIVLYIEDNPSNVRLMERIVQRRPDVVLCHAPTGERGLTVAAELSPTLILLDLHLPDIDGEEVLRRLHADWRLRDIPVAVLSADATPEQSRRLTALGAMTYLTKPLNVAKVLRLLDRWLRQQPGELAEATSSGGTR